MPSSVIVAGIDVGGRKKGFHAVALQDGVYLDQFTAADAVSMATWCRRIGAHFIGVDAPCHWSDDGRARPAERELMKENIWCFSSPTRATAKAHPKDNFGWMLNGEALFAELASTHPLFDNTRPSPNRPLCFETFPQAIACALAGRIVSAKSKRTTRRQLLTLAGIDIQKLTNIDKVDATLCALAALRFSKLDYRAYGEKSTGFIVVPGSPTPN